MVRVPSARETNYINRASYQVSDYPILSCALKGADPPSATGRFPTPFSLYSVVGKLVSRPLLEVVAAPTLRTSPRRGMPHN